MKKKYLIIVAHPDDETLGCGALIHHLRSKNNKVKVVVLGEGSSCRYKKLNLENIKKINFAIEQRKKYCLKALKILKVKDVSFYNLKCGRFDVTPIIDIASIIESEIKIFKPQIILTHSINDIHIDHQVSYKATLQATRPGTDNKVEKLLSFEILSSSEKNFENVFSPNYYFEISKKNLKAKIDALKCYKTEVAKHPFSRSSLSVKSLAALRGAQSGNYFAEAFKIVRSIQKKKQ